MNSHWRDDADCQYIDPETFFPDTYGPNNRQAAAARDICQACPVRALCLTDALHQERGLGLSIRAGIFGGHTPAERYDMRVGRTTTDLLTTHGTYQGWLFGCRCYRCEAAYQFQLRYEASLKRVPPGVQHGKPRAYERYGCQCDICSAEKERIRAKEQQRLKALRDRIGQPASAAA